MLPFVRCVGIGTGVYQANEKKAYDWRMICVLQGEGTLLLAGERMRTYAGDLFLVQPGVSYRVRSDAAQTIAVINFDTTGAFSHIAEPVLSVDASGYKTEKSLATKPFAQFTDSRYKYPGGELYRFTQMYRLYLREDLPEAHKSFLLSSDLLRILSKALLPSQKVATLAGAVYDFVLENACQKLTIEQVAQAFNYSPSYVEKLLRKHYQTSFRQLIIDTRLKKALWLLENSSYSCEQIAFQLGFYSSQHFSQTFRKRYGRSPRQYR